MDNITRNTKSIDNPRSELPEGPDRIEIPSVGVGTLRASGSWIILMLASETESQRLQIILEVMARLGISLEDLEREYNDSMCPRCGVSTYYHEGNKRGGITCPKR
jgi:hypothetical protein